MNTHDSRPRRPRLTPLLLTLAAALVLATGFTAGTAQSDDEEGERKFENGIPAHVPLKVKMKNERAFKDKKNKKWAEGLEIEVTNTGRKPIYYIYLSYILEGFDLGDGHQFVFRVKYGRPELAFLETPLEPDDVPIKPGESATIKLYEGQSLGFEEWREKRGLPDVMKVKLEMHLINFGDGTGLRFPHGEPDKARQQSSSPPPQKRPAGPCAPAARAPDGGPPVRLLNAFLNAPAGLFSRVRFFPPAPAPAVAALAQLTGGCSNC